MEILEGVNAGWSRGDVAGFLIAKRLKDGELASWLRRFGSRLFEGEHDDTADTDAVASLQELGRRLELLGRIRSGELSEVAGNTGREILTRFPLPVVEDDGGYGNVIEAVFLGDGLGVSGDGNSSGADGAEEVNLDAKAWFDRGFDQLMRGDFIDAIASLDKALEIKPDDHAAWYNRGVALDSLGRLEEAIASLDKALEIQPDFYDAWNNRGRALFNLGRFQEAIASFDRAIALKPDYHQFLHNRDVAQRQLEQTQ